MKRNQNTQQDQQNATNIMHQQPPVQGRPLTEAELDQVSGGIIIGLLLPAVQKVR